MEYRQILTVFILVGVCALLNTFISKLLNKILVHSNSLNPKVRIYIEKAIKTLLIVIEVNIVCSAAGIPTTIFTALSSIVAIAISLATQGLLQNIVSGTIINTYRPYKVGDLIENKTAKGTVLEIGSIATKLKRVDGALVIIPNNELQKEPLINYTTLGKNRIEATVSVEYTYTPEQIRKAMLYAAKRTPGVLDDPAPMVVLTGYDESGITYSLRAWANHEEFFDIQCKMTEELFYVFREYKINIPYPKLTVLQPDEIVELPELPDISRISRFSEPTNPQTKTVGQKNPVNPQKNSSNKIVS